MLITNINYFFFFFFGLGFGFGFGFGFSLILYILINNFLIKMFYCTLCEKEVCYVSKFCDKCRKIKHYLNLYEGRVYEVLDNVLSRTHTKQDNKIQQEIKEEIEVKKQNLQPLKK